MNVAMTVSCLIVIVIVCMFVLHEITERKYTKMKKKKLFVRKLNKGTQVKMINDEGKVWKVRDPEWYGDWDNSRHFYYELYRGNKTAYVRADKINKNSSGKYVSPTHILCW